MELAAATELSFRRAREVIDGWKVVTIGLSATSIRTLYGTEHRLVPQGPQRQSQWTPQGARYAKKLRG